MIVDAEQRKVLKGNGVIIEPTSGNTGVGLAMTAASRGYRTIIVMPENMSEERKKLMTAYGAELVLTPAKEGMKGAIAKAEELQKEIHNSIIMDQFNNPANAKIHYLSTGPEIWKDTDGEVDILVSAVGTGGTLTGTGIYLVNYLKGNTLEMDVCFNYSTDINDDEIRVNLDGHELILKERKLVVGIGCRRGKECLKIFEGLKKSINELNIDISRVNQLASAEIKKDEKGILELSQKLDIPVNFVDLDKLKLFESRDIQKSEFVKSKFGIYGVCEPSALITAGFDSKLIYKKTSYDGVTIAIAISK